MVIGHLIGFFCFQKQIRPPAASYRRPAFEPINLADADFAAAPITASSNFTNPIKQNNVIDNVLSFNNSHEDKNSAISSIRIYNETNITLTSTDVNKNSEVDGNIIENTTNTETVHSDDTPDLLDSKTLKPVQRESDSSDENLDVNNQLPDITSVRSNSVSDEISVTQPVFDLIKPNVPYSIPCNSEELPPVVSVDQLIKEDILDLQVNVVSFEAAAEPTEAEVEEYLNNIDIEECSDVERDTSKEESNQSLCESDDQLTADSEEHSSGSDTTAELSSTVADMGLTGSSNKNEKNVKSTPNEADLKEERECKNSSQDYDKRQTEKTSLFQEFPPESTFSSKKCELGNINSRPCTNHSKNNLDYTSNEKPSSSSTVERLYNEQFVDNDKYGPYKTEVSDVGSSDGLEKGGILTNVPDSIDSRESSSGSRLNVTSQDSLTNQSETSAPKEIVNESLSDEINSVSSTSKLDPTDCEEKPIRPNTLPLSGNDPESEESPTPSNTLGN